MVFISAYVAGSETNEKKRETVWSELLRCDKEKKRSSSHVLVLGDLNARAWNNEVLSRYDSVVCRKGMSV